MIKNSRVKSKIRLVISLLILLCAIASISGCSSRDTSENQIVISAAASLEEPLGDIVRKYEAENTDTKIIVNLGSSGTLRKQIEEGAEVDLFLSANSGETAKLVEAGIVDEEANEPILLNRLLLVKSPNAKKDINSVEELNTEGITVAIGGEGVPLGKYSEEVLKNLNISSEVADNIIYCKDAKSTLNYVKRGEVDYAIVYANERDNLSGAEIVEEISNNLHQPIVYSLAQINPSDKVTEFKSYILHNLDVFEEYNFDRY